jgi:DNA-binding MarR family transcriptional regulator
MDGLDADLGWSLGVVFRSYVKAAEAIVGDLPGGARGYQVLAAAAQELAGSQAALGQRLGIDRTVLTYLIDDLEELGLVERRQHPTDRRHRRIVATSKGRAQWRKRQRALRDAERRVLGPLGPDGPAFREQLCRLAAHVNAADPVTDACQVVEELGESGARARRPARRRAS